MSLSEELIAAIAMACNVNPVDVSLDTGVIDIGLDSITLTAVVMQMEAKHQLGIAPDDVAMAFRAETVGDFITCMESAFADHAR